MVNFGTNALFYAVAGVHFNLNLIELSVIVFFFYQWTKPKSMFSSAYFIILACGYCFDFVFSICWISGHLSRYSIQNPLLPGMLFVEWSAQKGIGLWEAILGANRSTSLLCPMLYSKIWTKKTAIFCIFLIAMFPIAIDWQAFTNPACMFYYYYEPQCLEFHVREAKMHAIINISFGALSLTMILVGIWRAPKRSQVIVRTEKVKMEHRLVFQTLLSATMLTLTFLGEYFFIYFEVQEIFIVAYIFYIIEFYPPIFILFYASATFRKEYLRFYRLDRSLFRRVFKSSAKISYTTS